MRANEPQERATKHLKPRVHGLAAQFFSIHILSPLWKIWSVSKDFKIFQNSRRTAESVRLRLPSGGGRGRSVPSNREIHPRLTPQSRCGQVLFRLRASSGKRQCCFVVRNRRRPNKCPGMNRKGGSIQLCAHPVSATRIFLFICKVPAVCSKMGAVYN